MKEWQKIATAKLTYPVQQAFGIVYAAAGLTRWADLHDAEAKDAQWNSKRRRDLQDCCGYPDFEKEIPNGRQSIWHLGT